MSDQQPETAKPEYIQPHEAKHPDDLAKLEPVELARLAATPASQLDLLEWKLGYLEAHEALLTNLTAQLEQAGVLRNRRGQVRDSAEDRHQGLSDPMG